MQGPFAQGERSRKAEKFSAPTRLAFPSGKVRYPFEFQPRVVMEFGIVVTTIRLARNGAAHRGCGRIHVRIQWFAVHLFLQRLPIFHVYQRLQKPIDIYLRTPTWHCSTSGGKRRQFARIYAGYHVFVSDRFQVDHRRR